MLKQIFATAFILLTAATAYPLDKTRYIDTDEIHRGMEGYCYTVIADSKIEKFPLKVISVVKGLSPGRDAILVVGTDDTFKHIGAVRGCSGSPVYIDGRMAGALSSGWGFSKDPLYGVTPIKYMLEVGTTLKPGQAPGSNTAASPLAGLDFTKQLDLLAARDLLFKEFARRTSTQAGQEFPIVSSLPANACSELSEILGVTNIFPLASSTAASAADSINEPGPDFAPGGVLTIPLVSGDISLAVTGTITEVDGKKVYAFGHSFTATGAIDMPMAEGKVHTVVASRNMSFKLASPGKIVGAIRSDEQPGIYGVIGEQAYLIPLNISITRYNASPKTFNCKLLNHHMYTTVALQAALTGVVSMQGSLPNEHTLTYSASIGIKDRDNITFSNISSNTLTGDLAGDVLGATSVLMNSPFGKTEINSIDVEIDISAIDNTARVLSAELDRTTYKPGDTVNASVVLQSHFDRRSLHELSLQIPGDTPPGKYNLIIAGGKEYETFLRKARPHNYLATDNESLYKAINGILNIKRDGLILLMPLQPSGVVVETSELPSLPPSKAVLLKNPTRTTPLRPFNRWIQSSHKIDKIISANNSFEIEVE